VVSCMAWFSEVLWSGVWSSAPLQAKVFRGPARSRIVRYGTVQSCLVRLRAARQALVSLWLCGVRSCMVTQGGENID